MVLKTEFYATRFGSGVNQCLDAREHALQIDFLVQYGLMVLDVRLDQGLQT